MLYELRLKYYASLGHADDKVAMRRLERLNDYKAEQRLQDDDEEAVAEPEAKTEPNNQKEEAVQEPDQGISTSHDGKSESSESSESVEPIESAEQAESTEPVETADKASPPTSNKPQRTSKVFHVNKRIPS